MAAQWGSMSWMNYNGSSPILDVYMEASVDMVEFHSAVIFQAFGSQDQHLRIDVSFLSSYYYFFLKKRKRRKTRTPRVHTCVHIDEQ